MPWRKPRLGVLDEAADAVVDPIHHAKGDKVHDVTFNITESNCCRSAGVTAPSVCRVVQQSETEHLLASPCVSNRCYSTWRRCRGSMREQNDTGAVLRGNSSVGKNLHNQYPYHVEQEDIELEAFIDACNNDPRVLMGLTKNDEPIDNHLRTDTVAVQDGTKPRDLETNHLCSGVASAKLVRDQPSTNSGTDVTTSSDSASDNLEDGGNLTSLGIGTTSRSRVDTRRRTLRRTVDNHNQQGTETRRQGRETRRQHCNHHQRSQQPVAKAVSVHEHSSTQEAHQPSTRSLRRARKRAEQRSEVCIEMEQRSGCVVLVREDCRLHDNPALYHAVQSHPWVVLLYVHDDSDPSPWPVRGAGLWWRHESLRVFHSSLGRLGSRIVYRRGCYISQVLDVLLDTGASALHFNKQLEPWHHARDLDLENAVSQLGLQVRSFKAMVCAFEPWDVRDTKSKKDQLEDPLPSISTKIASPPDGWPWSLDLAALGYGRTGGRKIPPGFRQFNEKRQRVLDAGHAHPKEDDWAFEMRQFWRMGEYAAMERLEEWIKDAAWGCYFPPGLHPQDTAGGRFRADKKWTAIISPYLRFGDLSPRYVYARCRQSLDFELRRLFIKRIVWRDKAYAQLYRWPDSHSISIRSPYEHERWSGTRLQLRRWQRGETGFPLVDAAMRQLWRVGWMCNHLRHVTAQFLIEHLDLSWKDGFAWYDYTLVDTDVAINAMMWQMGGHSGIGAWNFVMHPVFAAKKVDPDGAYVRRWLPELGRLPLEYIHCPWDAPAGTRIAANVLINGVYWKRVVEDLIAARLAHQKNVIEVRLRFPEFVDKDGTELLRLGNGRILHLEVRDDIRENDEEKLTLMMTADDPRSSIRRNLGTFKGVQNGLIYDEAKRFEAMYDAVGAF